VIGNDEKVERPAELDGQPRGGPDFLATGKPVRILGRQCVPEQARVERVSRVQVRLAPVNLAWKLALRIGRVSFAGIQLAGFGGLNMRIYLGGRYRRFIWADVIAGARMAARHETTRAVIVLKAVANMIFPPQ
jgi:hypothetical protein